MKTLEQNLIKYLKENFTSETNSRENVNIKLTESNGITGTIISDKFNKLSSMEQQQFFLKEIINFLKINNIKKTPLQSVLLYSPEEYLQSTLFNNSEITGILRSIDLNTLSANDIIISLSQTVWETFTKTIDTNEDPEKTFLISGSVLENVNSHLYKSLDTILQNIEFKYFDSQGYCFEISKPPFAIRETSEKFRIIELTLKPINPWDIPNSAIYLE